MQGNFISSPLNYTGGKYRLLPQIMPLFPRDISTAVDLFCGGANVGINIKANNIILNDSLTQLTQIYQTLQKQSIQKIFEEIWDIITTFELSNSAKMGYEFYQCNSQNGLSSFNKDKFLQLRNHYNIHKNALDLFVLIIFAFNNQIRFNARGHFNLPCGKRDFNINMQEKLKHFMIALQKKNIEIFNNDFREFDVSILDSQSFIYIDPPYFLATATYNENQAWGLQDELDLLEFLRILDSKKIRFALSNVICHKGKEHIILKKWLEKNINFKTFFLEFNYKNCNYRTKRAESTEVLVANY
ncbi:MAG: DNA adenine methylase [Helicobacter sp.]|nr:DNA adenine methylase [Helicobacter sp.]